MFWLQGLFLVVLLLYLVLFFISCLLDVVELETKKKTKKNLLTDSGSILCCSRNAENSTNRSGCNQNIADVIIVTTKINNAFIPNLINIVLQSITLFHRVKFLYPEPLKCVFQIK